MAQPDRPIGGGGQDANAIYALGSSYRETERLRRQAEELAVDSASLLDRPTWARDSERSIWDAARVVSSICWPCGWRLVAPLSGWTPTPSTSPPLGSSSPSSTLTGSR